MWSSHEKDRPMVDLDTNEMDAFSVKGLTRRYFHSLT